MSFLFNVLLFAHFLGLATLVGALFLQWFGRAERMPRGWLWGSLVQAVTGLAMVGLRDAGLAETPLDAGGHAKIGVKLVVLLVIALLAVVGHNRPARARSLGFTMGALTVLNVGVAVFWN